jgi:zinc protease
MSRMPAGNVRWNLRFLLRTMIALCLLSGAAWGAAAEADVDLTLANGLRILVQEDHRTSDVVVQIWYRVGSIDETEGKTGLSHLVEHLMFTGTADMPDDAFARSVSAAGGRINAFTGYHYTAYSAQLPAAGTELVLRMEADRMRNLAISAPGFAKAIEAVRAERKWRIDDVAQARLREQLMARVFSATPFEHPVIGWKEDIDRLQAVDARAWYARWYGPDAAVLVIVGNVRAAEVADQARRLFGLLPSGNVPLRRLQPQASFRSGPVALTEPSTDSRYLAVAYPVPGLGAAESEREACALQILAALLQEQPVADANNPSDAAGSMRAWYDMFRPGISVLLVDGSAQGDATLADLEAGLHARIEALKRDGVSEDRFERVKARLSSSETGRLQAPFERARRIGLMATMGLPLRDIDAVESKMRSVRAEEVRDAARRYLVDERRTSGEPRQ